MPPQGRGEMGGQVFGLEAVTQNHRRGGEPVGQAQQVDGTVAAMAAAGIGMWILRGHRLCGAETTLAMLLSMHVGSQGYAVAQDGDDQPDGENATEH